MLVYIYIYRQMLLVNLCWFSESQFTNELTKNTFAALHYKHQLRTESHFYYLWDYNAQHVQKISVYLCSKFDHRCVMCIRKSVSKEF